MIGVVAALTNGRSSGILLSQSSKDRAYTRKPSKPQRPSRSLGLRQRSPPTRVITPAHSLLRVVVFTRSKTERQLRNLRLTAFILTLISRSNSACSHMVFSTNLKVSTRLEVPMLNHSRGPISIVLSTRRRHFGENILIQVICLLNSVDQKHPILLNIF